MTLDAMMMDARRKKLSVVLVAAFDRIARSTKNFLQIVDLPGDGKAWVCDTVKWAIYPEKYRELQEWSRNSPEGKLLRQILGQDLDEKITP
jgi:hypothetical protein